MSTKMAEADDCKRPVFLRGGGSTAALIAKHDWASTPLGPLTEWPQSLRTATAIILQSRLPMVLMWGPEAIILYNDAYQRTTRRADLPMVGAKATEAWPEFAEFVDSMMKAVFAGERVEFRDYEMTRTRDGKAEQVWFDLDYSLVPDEAGRPAGVLGVTIEVTDRVLAERDATKQAERQRRLFDEAPGFVCVLSGPDHVVEFMNNAYKRLFGGRDAIGKPLREIFPEFNTRPMERVYATGERRFGRAVPFRFGKRPDGRIEQHYADYVLEPVIGEHGQVTGVFIEGFDVTQQVRAQAAVRESERRLSAALAIARLGAFEWDLETLAATLDARAREIFGFGADEAVKVGDVLSRICEEDATRLLSQAEHLAGARGREQNEYRIHLPDGSIRHVMSLSDVVAGPDGRTTRIIGVFADITERRRADNRQRMLINELNHRVKNTLANVQSIAAQTLRTAPDLARAREAFEARLVALAAAHDLLTTQSWHGAPLSKIISTAMTPFESGTRSQISRTGPPVWLSAQHALALSLAMHELATNAAKYGALSTPQGRVTIHWSRTAAGALTLTWTERGGPTVVAPQRSGFGTRLLQRGLAHDLHGEVALSFAPEGLRCEIRCTLEDPQPAPEPEFEGL
jgi:PAS domain S-box-containing protein